MAEGAKPAAEMSAEQRRELLRQILEKKSREPRVFPLSLGQEALWFLDRLDPGRPTYGFYPAVHVRGALDLDAFQRAFAEVMRRHDVFRTTFPEVNGGPIQRVVPPFDYPMPIIDLRDMDKSRRELECRRLAEARPPIDLQNGPVIRAQLIRVADDDHVVLLHIHHIVFDGWSLGVLARELLALYSAFKAGQPSPLKPLTVQFADFAAWQRKHLQGEVLSQLQDHWRQRLAGLPPLELFTDHPRPAVRSSRGATLPLVLTQELTRAVVEFSKREHFTPFMTLLAGFQELLRRYSGQDDFAIGTPTANRRQKSFEPLIGYFINVLVLRADLSHDPTFRQLVQRMRDTSLDAYQHQELTLDKIVEAVQPPRDLSRHPLFQVMFVVQNNPKPTIALPGIELSPLGEMESGRTAKFELTVPLRMTERGFEGKINFNTDLFTAETVSRMADHYQMILAEALDNPDLPLSKLKLLRDAEFQQIAVDWNSRRLPQAAPRLVPDRFALHADRAPDAVAVVDSKRRWTYCQIDEASNRLARCLQQRGVGPERTVGVCLERSGELMITLLAILKAGGAYVPLDPGHAGAADERVRFILDDANVALVVTDVAHRGLLPADEARLFVLEREEATVEASSSDPVRHGATAETLAYIIYTSGSTGRPKGVMVTHGNLENAYLGWEHEYQLGTTITSHLQLASFGFDVFTGDFVRALCSGGKLVFCSKETMLEPVALLDLVRAERIDAAEFVPVVLRNLVQHVASTGEQLDGLRMVAVGSDAWYVEDHQRTLAVLGPDTRLVNSYGLTETTIDSTFFEGDVQSLPPTGIVPIGRPFPNVLAYVLDPWSRPVPVGVAGELFIGGSGVARGYLNRPELDAERFVADPFSTSPGARLCRTGDRVRWRADGQLEFLGRADDQVKIRGFRIEPGEVEEVLREHPSLAEAAVLARERQPGDLRLVAYLAPRPGEKTSIPELRRFLGERLPEYMVPTAFVSLETMPTTPNGKVDRRSLPEPQWDQATGAGEYVAPRTPLEQQLAVVWKDILNVPQISVHDSFFELGGNSLMAVRLTARIRGEFLVELPLVALFTAPTLEALAERIGELVAQGARPAGSPIPRVPRENGVTLSAAQELFFSIVQMFPNQPITNIYAPILLKGTLDVETLRRTITEVVRRHEILRTYFAMNSAGETRQYVLPSYDVDVPLIDLGHLPEAERTEEMRRRAREQASQPFVLDQPPLYRLELLRLSEREHALLTTITHIIFDGWSLHVLLREVGEIYEAYRSGLPMPLSELPVQYSDYAAWERETMQGPELERLLDYWRVKLAGVSNPQLPFKRVVPPGIRHLRDHVEFRFPDDLRPRIEQLARDKGATVFSVLLSVYKTLLHHYCNLEDVAVAVPTANRGRAETQRMIGVFVTTIFLRTQLSGNPTFTEVLDRVQRTFAEGAAHEAIPFPLLVQDLVPNYDPSRFPLVQVMFNYLQPGASNRARRRRELEIDPIPSDRDPVSTRTDLSLTIADARGRLRANFKFDSALFSREDMERFSRHYMNLLVAVLDAPDRPIDQISMLSDEERQQVVFEWNQTDVAFDAPACVHHRVEEQARLRPDATAVVFEDQSLTYGELNTRANRLAHRLRELGVGPDERVGLCLERSLDLPVAMLGIMKAGGAYVALDPEYPPERLEFMATDSEPRVIVTTAAFDQRLGAAPASRFIFEIERPGLADQPTHNPDVAMGADHAVYVIYTSGSTGLPKGAVNLHRGLMNRLSWEMKKFAHQPGDRFLGKTSLNFDPSFTETFRPLTSGGVLVLARPGGQRDPYYLAEMIERERIGMTTFVPSMLRVFLEQDALAAKCRSLKLVTCGGEALTKDLADLFRQRLDARLINMYGPTETSVGVTYWECDANDEVTTIPIGRPLANIKLYILDAAGNPQPIGVPGELFIGGAAVGRGYWKRPELTAERFLPDPFVGGEARMYKTGDLCRYLPDGNVDFMGRIDSQVKIRGNRVELGEIETRLNSHSQVATSAVLAQDDGNGDMMLVAYVVPRDAALLAPDACQPLVDELRQHVRARLPEFMTPSAFMLLASLPLMPNGKLHRAALPNAAQASIATAAPRKYVPPQGEIEQRLATIWEEVLRQPRVGRGEEFFNIGGTSLQAIRVMRRVSVEFGVNVAVTELFAARTIEALAAFLDANFSLAPAPTSAAESAASIAPVIAPAPSTESAPPAVSPPVPTVASVPAVAPVAAASAPVAPPRSSTSRHRRWLAPLRAKGDRVPLYCIHGLGGHIAGFLPLAKQLHEGRPVFGLQAQGLDGTVPPHQQIEEMATCYVTEIREFQPEGPYFISGWSLGGLIALEVARQLNEAGGRVPLLVMYDTHLRVSNRDVPEMSDAALMLRIAPQLRIPLGQLQALSPQQQWDLIAERAGQSAGVGIEEIRRLAETCRAHMTAVARFQPKTYTGSVMLFRADRARLELDPRWTEICPRMRVAKVPGDHYTMLQPPHVDVLAARLDAELAAAELAESPGVLPR